MASPVISESTARSIVQERSGGRCEAAIPYVCGGTADTVHHRAKRSHGGSWAPSNLIAACGSGTTGCHGWIESHPSDAKELGLWLVAGQVPTDVSVFIRWGDARSWWFLDDAGCLEWDESEFEPVLLHPEIQMLLSPSSSFDRPARSTLRP